MKKMYNLTHNKIKMKLDWNPIFIYQIDKFPRIWQHTASEVWAHSGMWTMDFVDLLRSLGQIENTNSYTS